MAKDEININELYAKDPIKADKIVWGRESDPDSRRGFIKKAGLATMAALLGGKIAFAEHMPAGLIPVGLADLPAGTEIPGKDGRLIILNDRPWNAETPVHLLDPDVTPNELFFVRNNGIAPEKIDLDAWTLTINGESCEKEVTISLADLKSKFKHFTYQLTLECGGNGRAEFNPPAKGNQWTHGAVGCPAWTGVRLKDVLEYAGVKSNAVYIGYYGADLHLSRDPGKTVISRGVPIEKALEDESLLAFQMNGENIPIMNGYPLRLVVGGWPASVSGKWLTRLVIRDRVHDGAKMGGYSYRVPCEPVEPGTEVPEDQMCIIESMPVKSLITSPMSGAMIDVGKTMKLQGHAWAGDLEVKEIHTSIDYGATWQRAQLNPPPNRLAWQRWKQTITFKEPGYYEVWARATDSNGKSQPMVLPGWNPKGYLNNATHRIAVKVK